MTTAKDLAGTWSAAAFDRACAIAHLDLAHLNDADFVPAVVRVGALPPGWPEAVAHRLALTLICAMGWRNTPSTETPSSPM
jgi:hypothetical protein